MTKEELAKRLNGTTFWATVEDLGKKAEDNGLVIAVVNDADNTLYLFGAIEGSVRVYVDETEGPFVYRLGENGLILSECDNEDCPYFKDEIKARNNEETIVDLTVYYSGSGLDEEADVELGYPLWYVEAEADCARWNFIVQSDDKVGVVVCSGVVFDAKKTFNG